MSVMIDCFFLFFVVFFFQAEDGIRDCLLSRGLGDVYKRQIVTTAGENLEQLSGKARDALRLDKIGFVLQSYNWCRI
ncbi:antimicrobial peptide ABC transporter ATP-binding component [Lactobacillus rhamnosus GG] [Lacticaseibacillus rhamnosus]|nr:antimicrobial peptide ABC transporter ATP-binding component [Lactobacillus rhamnosus GG] [Lacticaseibacillus rhamnosus]